MQFACTYPSGAVKASPYVRVVVSSGDLGTASTARVRAAYAGIALKVAKAVVSRLPCGNPVRLPDRPGLLPPG